MQSIFVSFLRFLWVNIQDILAAIVAFSVTVIELRSDDLTSSNDLIAAISGAVALMALGEIRRQSEIRRFEHALEKLPAKGVITIEENLDPQEWLDDQCKRIRANNFKGKEILVLQTYFAPYDIIGDNTIAAIKSGATARILLAKPDCFVAKIRSVDLHEAANFAAINGQSLLATKTKKLDREEMKRIQIRYYETIPPFSLYSINGLLLIGRFWHKKSTGKGFVEVVEQRSEYGSYILDAFESLWEDAQANKDYSPSKYSF